MTWTGHDRTSTTEWRATTARIKRRDRWTCQACAGHLCANQNLEVDHIVPVAFGGTDDDANLQTLGARPCHAAKTQAEAAEGKRRRSRRRPAPPHPASAHTHAGQRTPMRHPPLVTSRVTSCRPRGSTPLPCPPARHERHTVRLCVPRWGFLARWFSGLVMHGYALGVAA